MMTRRTICCLVAALALCATGAMAQPTFVFDFEPFVEGIQTSPANPVAVNQRLEVNIVLTDVDNLLGYSVSVNFDPAYLALEDTQENPGDLNFDSAVSLQELNNIIGFFVQNIKTGRNWPLTADGNECFIVQDPDIGETKPGVLVDLDGNNMLSLSELNRVIGDFVDDIKDPTGQSQRIVYWTDLLAKRGQFKANESVEVSDPPALSNAGQAGAGKISDITAVLLARPEDAANGRVGFGYDTTDLGPATLVTLKFKALQAGSPTLTFSDAVYILESFQTLDDVKEDALAGMGQVEIQ